VSAFRLIEAQKATHSVPKLCRMLGVSKSGYYAWRRRPPSERSRFDALLAEKIVTIHRNSRATYGSPRVHAELAAIGIRCSRKRVARLMRQQKLRGCLRGRRMKTTYRAAVQQAAPDLVGRNFAAAEPDRLWVADITYVRSGEGFLYLAFILDVCSRKVVGWSMATHLRTYARSSWRMPSGWRSRGESPLRGSCITRIGAYSTRLFPSASAWRRQASCPRWEA